MKGPKLVSVVVVTRDRKKDLTECINSFLKSTYSPLEIIIVDNNSNPPVNEILKTQSANIKIIKSDKNLGAAEGRNVGLEHSKGEYILFSDDDAAADKKMVEYLVEAFEEKKDAGIIQPLVYDKQQKNILQGAGHDIDLLTGRITAWGVREMDNGQYEGIRNVPMCGCVWMVKKEVFKKIGGYDNEYFIPYEDSDFSIRARNAGFKLYCTSKAKTYHQGKKLTYVHPWVEFLGITTPERAYRVARNKIIFIRKNSPAVKQFFFFSFFLPAYIFIHSLIILAALKFGILIKYWQGIFSGLNYALNFKSTSAT